jgi:pimeloyl-ACP methyl ester carboxylesterase
MMKKDQNPAPKLYVLSGLGADERVFFALDFSGLDVTFVHWIAPLPDERIEHYAERLCAQIDTPAPVLLGLSFGGIMATEIAKIIPTQKVILLSSAPTKWQIPFYDCLLGRLKVDCLFPAWMLKKANPVTHWLFGVTTPEAKQLLTKILAETDADFLRWAIREIAHWENTTPPAKLLHLHGTADRILPFRNVHADIAIQGGGHLMVIDKAAELSAIIRAEVGKWRNER